MVAEPPRLKHNRELAAAYIASAGSPPRWPKVTDQVECIPLDTRKLYPHGYNPTIVEQDGNLLMAYRYHEGTLASKLAAARFKETGEVISNWRLEANGHSLEDPKFFGNGLHQQWLSWVEAYWPVKAVGSVRYGFLRDNAIHEAARPVYGKNDGEHMEKNWTFFEHKEQVYFIYQCSPKQVVVRWSGKLEGEHITDGPRWPYGTIKGGTPPVEYDGHLIRFFHSTLDNEIDLPLRCYYIGACLMNPDPPFDVVRVSRKPVLYGSTVDGLTPDERKACIHWKPKVVFPGGVVERNGHWLLSLGVNDSACVVAKIKPENLNL